MGNTIILDTEVAVNGFLVVGKVLESQTYFHIWDTEPEARARVQALMSSGNTFITFNGTRYDFPILSAFISGKTGGDLKYISDAIIEHDLLPWRVEKQFKVPQLKADHLDLIEVAPSFVGLKTYGARMGMAWLQDLPFHHSAPWTEAQLPLVLRYCRNDVDTTEELYRQLEKPLAIRLAMSREYGVDMRSKSDSQMAESAFISRLRLTRRENSVPTVLRYTVPPFIQFSAPHLSELARKMQEHVYEVNQKTGHVVLPDFLGKELIHLGAGRYQMGVGGVHSTHDRSVCYVAGEDTVLTDIDAASFYPSILINGNLVPANLGSSFIAEYRSMYDRRLAAKRSGDKTTADTLRIALNGTFGKTASRWSPLYSPDVMLAITLTGQLTLLSLIEKVETAGAVVLSANTDGVAIAYPKILDSSVKQVVSAFSVLSGFEFEYTPYRALAMKDVNNYIAVKTDRSVKARGIYAPPDLRKNPTASICARAVAEWLARGTALLSTVNSGKIEEYISARNVTGGGVQGEIYLGKVVRWYSSTDKLLPPLTYAKNGNLVPKTSGARALMVMDKTGPLPADLDIAWYYKETVRIAVDVGCSNYLTPEQLALVAPPLKVKKPRKTKEPKNETISAKTPGGVDRAKRHPQGLHSGGNIWDTR